jgi:hypothetical protein
VFVTTTLVFYLRARLGAFTFRVESPRVLHFGKLPKYLTWGEVKGSNKHTSLLENRIYYVHEKFYRTTPLK